MPTPESIVAALGTIANDAVVAAVAWHVVLVVVAGALVGGWRPSKRIAGLSLVTPLASVAIVAWVYANPFNAAVFATLSLALCGVALRLGREPVQLGPRWARVAGAAMIAFGWTYPHFLHTDGLAIYLYAAPTGLIPCPTLSLIVGMSLVGGAFSRRAWALPLVVSGAFYGVYGALALGVRIDAALVAGALALAALAWRQAPADAPSSKGRARGGA